MTTRYLAIALLLVPLTAAADHLADATHLAKADGQSQAAALLGARQVSRAIASHPETLSTSSVPAAEERGDAQAKAAALLRRP